MAKKIKHNFMKKGIKHNHVAAKPVKHVAMNPAAMQNNQMTPGGFTAPYGGINTQMVPGNF